MRQVAVLDITIGEVLAERAEVADTFWSRFLGLQWRRPIASGTGLVLLPNSSIHMLFMRFPIDAVFVDHEGRVVRVARGLRPWISMAVASQALYCVELPAGAAGAAAPGHVIELRATDEYDGRGRGSQ